MVVKISVKSDIDRVVRRFTDEAKKQTPFALSRTLNETGKLMAKDGNKRIASVFDRPIPRTTSAVKVFEGATKKRLSVVVHVHDGKKGYDATDSRAQASGKSSVFPNQYLAAQIDGGRRGNKRFENALIKAGVMPAGMQAVFAKRSGYLDQYGNLTGARINQILSWFAAFPEAGYRANMTVRSKSRLRTGTKSKKTGETKFAKGRKWGVAYFVSAGERFGGLEMRLPPGVWERNYPNGQAGKSFIKPVLLFVQPASYRQRFDFYADMQASAAKHLPVEFDKAWALAMKTARR